MVVTISLLFLRTKSRVGIFDVRGKVFFFFSGQYTVDSVGKITAYMAQFFLLQTGKKQDHHDLKLESDCKFGTKTSQQQTSIRIVIRLQKKWQYVVIYFSKGVEIL